jgi:hypothetical protein
LVLAARIKTNVNRMSALIDDVPDFARGRLGGGIDLELTEVQNISTGLTTVICQDAVEWAQSTERARYDLCFATLFLHHFRDRPLEGLLGIIAPLGNSMDELMIALIAGRSGVRRLGASLADGLRSPIVATADFDIRAFFPAPDCGCSIGRVNSHWWPRARLSWMRG